MFLQPFEISLNLSVSDIVAKDYRTAEVFRRYGIGYCCGGKWPLGMACEMQGVDPVVVRADLENATRNIHVSPQMDFSGWNIDFLIDYIINMHHEYLKQSLPLTNQLLIDFAKEHAKKFTYVIELVEQFGYLKEQLESSMKYEEEDLFPYLRRVYHAHKEKAPYAELLVRTLRKTVEVTKPDSHEWLSEVILSVRNLTRLYTIPENVCTSHKVVIARLKELDNDLMQHFYLERSILYPRTNAIEKEVLAR